MYHNSLILSDVSNLLYCWHWTVNNLAWLNICIVWTFLCPGVCCRKSLNLLGPHTLPLFLCQKRCWDLNTKTTPNGFIKQTRHNVQIQVDFPKGWPSQRFSSSSSYLLIYLQWFVLRNNGLRCKNSFKKGLL